ncbi:MAG TPA: enoyl-CoA hydratase-related protein [Nitrospiraceae bacterium]|nr:enoyl-CoA hydratase-related protein [Nitrospiraceae bacterium]
MPLLTVTISNAVARITLENPPANVLSAALLKELEQCLDRIENDAAVRVVILTGSGRFFCAGADIQELVRLNTVQLGTEFAERGQELFNRIERSPKPVVAAINGTCVGGGLELALACHIRIAAAEAMLALPEVKLGLMPGFGGTQRLPRIVGSSKAIEMILTGESISAEEALKIGLLNRVVPVQKVLAEAETMAGVIASHGAAAVRAGLQSLSGAFERSFAEGLASEAELFGQLCVTKEKQESTQAFLEKRQRKSVEAGAGKTVARSS